MGFPDQMNIFNHHTSSDNFNSSSSLSVYLENSTAHLQIYFQNIGGMRSKLLEFRLSVLENNYDIITIVETWLYPDILISEFIDESIYNVFRRDRCINKQQRGGGLLIAVKSHLNVSEISLRYDVVEQLCVRITDSSRTGINLFICLSYIPPASNLDVYSHHFNNIRELVPEERCNDRFVVLGDFNLPSIAWDFDKDDKILVPFNISSDVERFFIDSLLNNNFSQVNNIPNSHGKFLDLVFTTEDFCCSVNLIDSPLALTDSHHYAICIKLDHYTFLPDSCMYDVSHVGRHFNFRRANFSALDALYADINWSGLLGMADLGTMYQLFIDVLNNSFSELVPVFMRRNNSAPPWYKNSLRRLKNARNKSHKRFLKFGGFRYRRNFEQLRREYQFLHRFLYRKYL